LGRDFDEIAVVIAGGGLGEATFLFCRAEPGPGFFPVGQAAESSWSAWMVVGMRLSFVVIKKKTIKWSVNPRGQESL